jgi:hypothetical protein
MGFQTANPVIIFICQSFRQRFQTENVNDNLTMESADLKTKAVALQGAQSFLQLFTTRQEEEFKGKKI